VHQKELIIGLRHEQVVVKTILLVLLCGVVYTWYSV